MNLKRRVVRMAQRQDRDQTRQMEGEYDAGGNLFAATGIGSSVFGEITSNQEHWVRAVFVECLGFQASPIHSWPLIKPANPRRIFRDQARGILTRAREPRVATALGSTGHPCRRSACAGQTAHLERVECVQLSRNGKAVSRAHHLGRHCHQSKKPNDGQSDG